MKTQDVGANPGSGLVRYVAVLAALHLACGQPPLSPGEEPLGTTGSSLTSTMTGSMSAYRTGATATRLQNGKVLIAGGYNSGNLQSSELYDPATGTFTPTGSMSAARSTHTATLLNDGRVLVIGGASTNTCELYDPTTGTWSATGAMNVRREHTATLLPNGKVLVVGGVDDWGSTFAQSVLYNPATGTWQSTQSTHFTAVSRRRHAAARLADGRVLITGGTNGSQTYYSDAWLYDPVSDSWSQTGNTSIASALFTSLTLLPSGKVLMITWSTAKLYDPATGTWSDTQAPFSPREFHHVMVSPLGHAILFGGRSNDTPVGSVERYVASSGTWEVIGMLQRVRDFSAAALVGTDKILVAGGSGIWGNLYDAELLQDDGAACTAPNCGQEARYDSTLQAPKCGTVGNSCFSGVLVDGRGTVEFRWPNTLNRSCATESGDSYHVGLSIDSLKVYTADGTSFADGKTVTIEAKVWANSSAKLNLFKAADAANPSWQLITTLSPIGTTNTTQVFRTTYALPSGSLQAIRASLRYGTDTLPCTTYDYDDHDDLVFAVQSVPDTTPPATAITAPAAGATVSGSVTLSASASDARGVTKVEFYVGARLAGTDTSAPFSLSWNTLTDGNGSHTLTSKAYDAAGNVGTSSGVTVTVSNDLTPPSVSITAPTAGTTVSGTVSLQASASDDRGVVRVELYQGTTLIGTDTAAPYSLSWNSRTVANGIRSLTAKAYDAAGNVGTSAAVTVLVDNDVTSPTVSITSPTSGATVAGTVTITATASDDRGVQKVDFYRGSTLLGTDTSAPYGIDWNTLQGGNGTYSLTATVSDLAGNVGTATLSVTVNNPGGASYDPVLKAPKCGATGARCDSGALLSGRANLGPETNAPNTLQGSCADGTTGSYHGDESLDQIAIYTLDGTPFAPGKTVQIDVTVWAYTAGGSDKLDLYYASDATNPVWTYLTTLTPTATGSRVLSATYVLPSGTLQAVRGNFRYGGSAGTCTTGSYDDRDDLVFAVQ
ncbi:Ig-like domain-containing protein [Hyalangium minutum]|uniref:Ig-like domain-containing protein n=1 Tax=Hyalangium minutum TaxID=394096 RepID=UPI000A035FB4|nr:Ig-like domain-containing protein [Hyalangium minutum]